MTPVMPPIVKTYNRPIAHNSGTRKLSRPPHIVAIQLKILIPVGTAMRKDMRLKKGRLTAPVVNMWWAQTVIERPAMRIVARMTRR